ncbi:MAG: cation:proton antiporter [Muribaculaceae bacterium]|nr:cation:proton antiporter [Muribaculaceae bacterium]MBO5187515.1 cation:proton antiporter [Prevotella sp.]
MFLAATTPLVTNPITIFFIVLAIILVTPLVFNRLKIPHIIGMIVAGIVIGPYGLNILDNDSSFAIFGQVGLLYLMFLAGLEIDMFHLKLNLKRGMAFGILTLVIPLLIGIFTSVYIFHLDWLTSMMLGAMYASHTLISYPVAVRFGITKSPAVLIAIVGTIIAVIGALLVIAGVVNVRHDGEFSWLSMGRLVGLLIIYCLGILYLYPRLTRWFFKNYSDRVTQYVYVMAVMLMAAWLASLINLEPVLGAFIAGLVLNRYIPASSGLMGSIEFVGNALFIPYFLISVGMMINMRVILEGDTLITSAIMLTVALVSKWLPAYITRRSARLDSPSMNVMFGLTTAHTAVALAVVTLGNQLGMFDERILNATVLVILVTCTLAPIITAAAAPRLKIAMLQQDEEADSHLTRSRRARVNNTLIPIANVESAVSLVEMAVLMRSEVGRHEFYALHVRNDNSPAARDIARRTLLTARRTATAANVAIETLDRYDLNTVTGVLNAIEERDITEVFLGLHRRAGVIDSFFGAKVEQLLRATNRMIIITRMFSPVNTITRIIIYVPPKAQYETGFSRWVRAIARLTRQIGCRAIFCSPDDIQPLIRGVIYQENYGIRCEFRTTEHWDDFIAMSSHIKEDDLLMIIGARVNSVSWNDDIAQIPGFLQRYFAAHNIAFIYPQQFGEQVPLTSFVDPLAGDISSAPSPLWRKIRGLTRRLHP